VATGSRAVGADGRNIQPARWRVTEAGVRHFPRAANFTPNGEHLPPRFAWYLPVVAAAGLLIYFTAPLGRREWQQRYLQSELYKS
jgi:hypothetical protein